MRSVFNGKSSNHPRRPPYTDQREVRDPQWVQAQGQVQICHKPCLQVANVPMCFHLPGDFFTTRSPLPHSTQRCNAMLSATSMRNLIPLADHRHTRHLHPALL